MAQAANIATHADADSRIPTPEQVVAQVRRRPLMLYAVLAAVIAYLAYAWVAFDIGQLLGRAQSERALLLAADSVAYKVHVTQSLKSGGREIAIEGERTSTYETPPDWVTLDGDQTMVDLGDGYSATIDGARAQVSLTAPGYGVIKVRVIDGKVETQLPDGPAPHWARISDRKFDARPTFGRRVQVSRTKIEIHRYFFGWENFFFAFGSELHGKSATEILELAMSGQRVDPGQSNASFILESFLKNPDWQHGEVFWALFDTIMMAFLGTATAAFVGLPLAFIAARNFTPSTPLRFLTRRVFDFLRGIDMLIWSLIFIRAFGLGPLTGALAIAFTDTGTLGKLFSEALENVDNKQIEGVRATGANQLQRYRFGVIPQILPVFVSQCLYYLESNTRSATVIGALGAGGIGLLLVQTIGTHRDWENTTYIIVLTIVVVLIMDQLSSWLRRRLIEGKTERTKG